MSPPPSRMAAPAAARSSYSFTPGLARATIAFMAFSQSLPALRTQSSSSSLWIDEQVVQEALGEDELGVGQVVAQHVVLVDRQVVLVARVDLHQADAAALELQLAQPLDHDVGVAAVAAVAHVLDRDLDLPAHRLGMRAAHRVDQRRLAIERHQHIAAERVPFPMAGEPQHAAAEAPVARPARHDDGVELVLAHLAAQRGVAALVFLLGELLVDRVAVIRRVAHVGERQRLVELGAHDLPRLRADARRLDVDVHESSR